MRFGTQREKYPVKTVEIVCTVADPARASYAIGGRRQRAGDKARMQLRDALTLEHTGKAKIVPDSEKTEML